MSLFLHRGVVRRTAFRTMRPNPSPHPLPETERGRKADVLLPLPETERGWGRGFAA
jgi:hypothetical protein